MGQSIKNWKHGNPMYCRNLLLQPFVMKKHGYYMTHHKHNQCKWFPVCPMKFYFEKGKIEKSWIQQYCRGDWEACVRYQKEEAGIYHPDNMMPDGHINTNLK
jgi:DNA polymerase